MMSRRFAEGARIASTMTDSGGPGSNAKDRLRRIDFVTATSLAWLDLDKLLQELPERVREVLRADTTEVLLCEEKNHQLIATAVVGIEEEVRQGVRRRRNAVQVAISLIGQGFGVSGSDHARVA